MPGFSARPSVAPSILSILSALFAMAMATLPSGPAPAAEVTLRLHHFLPAQSNIPKGILEPWAKSIETASDGRIAVQLYPAMTLGGTPSQLVDQVRDGVVDVIWTLPGYTPGRFPRTEVFELPFMMTDGEAASHAFWELVQSDMQDTDFRGMKILGAWVHGPGVLHLRGPGISRLEDMQGKKLRGASRIVNSLLDATGAVPVGMPAPEIAPSLARGVIDGALLPWEVTPSLKVHELTDSHIEFSGPRALYTITFILAMNTDRYDALPDDLRRIIDAHSGLGFSTRAGRIMRDFDAKGRATVVESGNRIIRLPPEEVARWQAVGDGVIAEWVAEMAEKNIDGQDLLTRARTAITRHNP